MDIDTLYTKIEGHHITTDTRSINEGDVFFAIKGEKFNGNTFAEGALNSGASYAIIDDPQFSNIPNTILVEDTVKTLQQIAAHHRRVLNIPILGITGTNGKTTTKELCYAVLSKKFRTVATQGNLNNHIGVPLTLLSMDKTTEFGIVEMGASHPGEIEELCNIADPDFGLITNIGEAHIEGFGNKENIIKTKTALYRHVKQNNGIVFVNSDDELLLKQSASIEQKSYGEEGNFTKGVLAQSIPFMVMELYTTHGYLYIKSKLIGGYNFYNAMAAACVGMYFGVSAENIQNAIENYTPGNMRSQLIKSEHNTIILDAYNANPSSMNVAISNFAKMQDERKVVILGEMRELGTRTESAHKEIVELAVEEGMYKIMLIGEPFLKYADFSTNISWFPNTEKLIEHLITDKPEKCLIFVKGSRGNRLERIVEYL